MSQISDASAAAVSGLIEDVLAEQETVVTDAMGNHPAQISDPGDMMANYVRVEAIPAQEIEQAAPVAPEPTAFPSWEADTTGIEDIFDEEDEPPVDDEPEFETLAPQPTANEWDDPEKRALQARLAKAERQIEWERKQRAKVAEKEWRNEAGRRFPFADPETINATSRRGFLRQAAEQHQRVTRKIQPVLDALEQTRSETVQEAKLVARAEAAQQWGRPTTGPSAAHAVPQAAQKEIRREDFKSFHEYAAAKLKGGHYGPI